MSNAESSNRKFASSTLIYIFSDVIVKAIPFLLIPIVTRFLTVEEYGNVSLYLTAIEIVTVIVTMGGQNYYRYQYFKEGNVQELIFVPLILTIATFIPLQFFLIFYHCEVNSLGYYLVLPIVGSCQSACALLICKFQMQQKPLGVASVNIALALFSFFSTVLFLRLGFGFDGRILSIVLTPLMIGIIISIFIFKNNAFSFSYIKAHFKKSVVFGAKSVPTSISWWLRSGMDRVIVQYLLGATTLGLYAVTLQLSLVVSVISIAINNSLIPKIFHAVNSNDRKSVTRTFYIGSSAILISAVSFYVVSPLLFGILLPERYAGSQHLLFPILSGVVFHGFFLMICNITTAMGRPGVLSIVALTGALFHMLLSYLLAHYVGIDGLVWSSAVSYLVSTVALFCYLVKNHRGLMEISR